MPFVATGSRDNNNNANDDDNDKTTMLLLMTMLLYSNQRTATVNIELPCELYTAHINSIGIHVCPCPQHTLRDTNLWPAKCIYKIIKKNRKKKKSNTKTGPGTFSFALFVQNTKYNIYVLYIVLRTI